MKEDIVSIVVVVGSQPLEFLSDPRFSKRQYGNYLAELWSEIRRIAVSMSPDDALTDVLKLRNDTDGWMVVTDNVDGALRRAGVSPLVEMSGNVFRGRCMRCGTVMNISTDDYRNLGSGEVFTCISCGKPRVRPDIVLEGEKSKLGTRKVRDFLTDASTIVLVNVEPQFYIPVHTIKVVDVDSWVTQGGPLTGPTVKRVD